jgi:uncharacterized membrane protein
MAQTLVAQARNAELSPRSALRAAARLWFVTAVIGQWLFFYYLIAFYGPSTLGGHFEVWRRNKALNMSYVPGDAWGNLAFASHVLLAAVIAFGGALQLLPKARARVPTLHRWNGRLFMVVALGLAASGLYIVWVRADRSGGIAGGLAISLNAVLIILMVAMAWRTARARDFAAHRRWALRAWIASNGQWFTRIGFMAVAMLNHSWAEPFFAVWSYGSTLAPLAVLELYLRVEAGGGPRAKSAVAGGLVLAAGLTGIGVVGAYLVLWRPLLAPA